MYAATEGKYTLLILEDSDPLNPRRDYSNMGRMVCWHRKYDLGDQHDYADPIEFLQDMAMTFFKEKPEQVFEYIKAGRDSEARLEYDGKHRRWRLMELCSFGGEGKWYEVANYDQLMQNKHISSDAYYDVIHAMSTHGLISMLESIDGFVFLPLYLFDHSGITMNTSGFSCPWDSGQVGWIFCTPDKLQAEYGEITPKTIQQATEVLEAEVRIYDTYLRGECYGYRLYLSGEEIDSCWDFLGGAEEMKADLRMNLPPEAASLVDALEYTCESEASYLLNHTVS